MKKLLLLLLLLSSFFVFSPAQAQVRGDAFGKYFTDSFGRTFDTGSSSELNKSLPRAVGNVISVFIAFIGVILLVIMVYAGFLWLTAGGKEDQIKKAKQYIINGIIGLIIALGAFILTSFVITQVTNALNQSAEPASTSTGNQGTK